MRLRGSKLLSRLAALALLAALASACGGPKPDAGAGPGEGILEPVTLDTGEKLRVVATTNIIGDVVKQVGGDLIELTALMGPGVDPHTYVPTPADTAAIHDAYLVVANGAGLEANLEEVFKSAGGEAALIYLSDGLELRKVGATAGEAGGKEGHGEGDLDPHVWFDVHNVIRWVDTVERTLSSLDQANAEAYRANAATYTRQLEELDAWVVDQIATIPQSNRKLVTNHLAFGYLAGRYGLEQVGAVYPLNPAAEPSAQDIAALEDLIRTYDVLAIFSESTVSPKLAEQVAQDTGVKLVALYSGSLGGPGSGAESYVDLIRYDVTAIVDALK